MIEIGGSVFELEGDGLRIESLDDCIILTREETLELAELVNRRGYNVMNVKLAVLTMLVISLTGMGLHYESFWCGIELLDKVES